MNTIKQFINKHSVKISSEYTDNNPNWEQDGDRSYFMNHYKVVLSARFDGKRRQMTTYFSMGLGLHGEPQAADVLDCLASDAAGVENAGDFEDWASEYGYDTDSRKAERIYKNCKRAANRLYKFLNSDSEIYNGLLFETEKL